MMISVLTPSYNSVKYLARAIESVLEQDYGNWEHIIIDGGSEDGTIAVLERYPHLIWRSTPDRGQSDAMNKAFALAKGDLIVYLNADDAFEMGWFSKVIEMFTTRSNIDIVISNLRISQSGEIAIAKPSASLLTVLHYWPCRFPMNPVSYVYKRHLQEKIGPFPLRNHYTMDYWFLLRAYLIGNIAVADFTGGTFYVDGTNKSSNLERALYHLKKVRNDFLLRYFYTPPVLCFFSKHLVSIFRGRLKRLFATIE